MAKEACSRQHRRRKCCICRDLFHPDPRNRYHQRACSKPDCQKARKRQSQRRWLAKAANQNYFAGPENVRRVQQWRLKHPDYWKSKAQDKTSGTLKDLSTTQPVDNQLDTLNLSPLPLQDVLSAQVPLFVGLISQLTGSTLQDDIAHSSRQMILKGCDILGISPSDSNSTKDTTNETKETHRPSTSSPCAPAVQLDRPASAPG